MNKDELTRGGLCCAFMVYMWLAFCGLAWLCRKPILAFFVALDAGNPWATLPVALAFLLVLVVCLNVRDT